MLQVNWKRRTVQWMGVGIVVLTLAPLAVFAQGEAPEAGHATPPAVPGHDAPAAAPAGAADPDHKDGAHKDEVVLEGKTDQTLYHPNGMTFRILKAENGVAALEIKENHPTLPFTWQTDLALWSFVTFVLIALILGKFAWGPLISALDQREAKIRKDIDDAEHARVAAEKLLVDYRRQLEGVQEEVRKTMAEARRDAEHLKQEMIATAEREAAASRQRAVLEIERARDTALSELFASVGDMVADATEQVIGRALSEADHERLVGEAVSAFASRQS